MSERASFLTVSLALVAVAVAGMAPVFSEVTVDDSYCLSLPPPTPQVLPLPAIPVKNIELREHGDKQNIVMVAPAPIEPDPDVKNVARVYYQGDTVPDSQSAVPASYEYEAQIEPERAACIEVFRAGSHTNQVSSSTTELRLDQPMTRPQRVGVKVGTNSLFGKALHLLSSHK